MKTHLRLFSFLGPVLCARLPISRPAQAAMLPATPLSRPAKAAMLPATPLSKPAQAAMLPATPISRPAKATPIYAAPLFCQQAALFPANQLSRPAQADVLYAWPHSIHNGHQLQPHGLTLYLPVIECPAAQSPSPPCSERAYVFVTRVLSTTENLAAIWPQNIIADHDCCRASVP